MRQGRCADHSRQNQQLGVLADGDGAGDREVDEAQQVHARTGPGVGAAGDRGNIEQGFLRHFALPHEWFLSVALYNVNIVA